MKLHNLKTVLPAMAVALLAASPAFAAENDYLSGVGIGAGLAIGLAALGGAFGQGNAARGMYESIARNPQAAGKLNAPFYVGMALIESLVIYALVIAYYLQGYVAH